MKTKLTPLELAEKLQLHQRWRRGMIDKMPLEPKELGEVIDQTIRFLKASEKPPKKLKNQRKTEK